MSLVIEPGSVVLDNDFWSGHITSSGLQVSARDDQALLFCGVGEDAEFSLEYAVPDGQANRAIDLTYTSAESANCVQLRCHLNGASLSWELIPDRLSKAVHVRFPFLTRIFGEASPGSTLISGQAFKNVQGQPIFRHTDWPLPVSRIEPDGETITLLLNRAESKYPAPENVIDPSGFLLQPQSAAIGGEIVVHEGGWPTAFDLLRQRVRAQFDLSEYQRPDLAWYQDQLVQHFTFLYGREIYNHATYQFELERFLDEAERDFGGVDGFLIWGVYPRIGVDERTQWDFYDDMPGGRAGFRAMAQRARERGVRFFVPYKPWDRSAELHGYSAPPDSKQLAQLVADVEADGVFLDTMSAIDEAFRREIDAAREGVVFCSEGRAKGKAFEVITGSWDQTLNRNYEQGNWSAKEEYMPGADLWRFIFPEHRLFVINRHAVGADRIRIIQRGFFSGMGWVIWQDIFGLVLTCSPDEAALLKKCAALFRAHREALASPHPTPLIATLVPGVYCNEFPAANKRLWTFYNESDHAVDAPVLQLQPRTGTHIVDVWNERSLKVDDQGCLSLWLHPRSLGAVIEFPELLSYSIRDRQFRVTKDVPGAQLRVSQDGLDWSGSVDEQALWQSERPIVARLMLGGEVLDQLIIEPQETGDSR